MPKQTSENYSSNGKKESRVGSQKRQWIAPSQSDESPKPSQPNVYAKPLAEEKKQTTATFGGHSSTAAPKEQPEKKRDDSSSLTREKQTSGGVSDNKPKLFKGSSTNPFSKRTAPATGPSFSGNTAAGSASTAPKNDGLFFPGSNKTTQPDPAPATTNNFSSITSFGARNQAAANEAAKSGDRKSSSNIEEALDYDDDFEEESLGQSQLNPGKTPSNNNNNANWGSSGKRTSEQKKPDGSSNLDDFSAGDAFEDKYDDDDFL